MTSMLYAPNDVIESEASHGTVTRHFRMWQQGQEVSTNPIASIFAWTRGLFQRAFFDELPELMDYSTMLEKAVVGTVESGTMTKDLALLVHGEGVQRRQYSTTTEFLDSVRGRFDGMVREFTAAL
jgi:isocitrate dehydrogenase